MRPWRCASPGTFRVQGSGFRVAAVAVVVVVPAVAVAVVVETAIFLGFRFQGLKLQFGQGLWLRV